MMHIQCSRPGLVQKEAYSRTALARRPRLQWLALLLALLGLTGSSFADFQYSHDESASTVTLTPSQSTSEVGYDGNGVGQGSIYDINYTTGILTIVGYHNSNMIGSINFEVSP